MALALAGPAPAQRAPAPSGGFPKPERPVADIVSPRWSADADRDRVDESGQIAKALGLKAGQALADIGAGTGYHTFRLAPIVGPTGRIFAEDIVPRYLDALEQDVRRSKATNVSVVRGTADDPKLPPGSVDAAIMVHMYHEIEQPFALLWNLAPAFKGGGKLAIIDRDAPTFEHGTPPDLLRCELTAVGYRQLSFTQMRNDQAYIAVFAPPAANARPAPGQIKACRG